MNITISFDASEIEGQIKQLKSLLHNIPETLRGRFFDQDINLSHDVLFTKKVTTVGTEDTCHIVYHGRRGSKFEDLVSTLRAMNGEVWHNWDSFL